MRVRHNLRTLQAPPQPAPGAEDSPPGWDRGPCAFPRWLGSQPRLRGAHQGTCHQLTPAKARLPTLFHWAGGSQQHGPSMGSSSLLFPPLPTRSSAPGGLSSACSGDSPAGGHAPLLRDCDLTFGEVVWVGASLSLARQRQAIGYRPASGGHQRLPGTFNHPASELGPKP